MVVGYFIDVTYLLDRLHKIRPVPDGIHQSPLSMWNSAYPCVLVAEETDTATGRDTLAHGQPGVYATQGKLDR